MVTILLCVTLVGVYLWGQYWKDLACRITDIVNEILSEEEDDASHS